MSRARICKRLRSPGIDSKEAIPQGLESIPGRGGHRHLQIGRMLDIDLISEAPPPDVCIQSVGICVARRGRKR